MNDLDLRTPLQRDADLVGEPSPNLLEQLGQRRRHQRRRRAGMLTVAMAVAVIAAGIPVGQSLLTRADGGPADTPAVAEETPSLAPTTEPAAPTTADPSTVPPESSAPAPSTADAPVGCPTLDDLRAAMGPTDSAGNHVRFDDPKTACSGDWAVAFPTFTFHDPAYPHEWGDTQLFHYIDGAWKPVDRMSYCLAGQVPAAIDEWTCHTN